MLKALLIDDEISARTDLRLLLEAHASVKIVGEAALLADARALLAGADYDLVFLDIQLIGGTGFDLVPAVRPGARIIFVTAHDQFALRAFEVNALDYLVKPVMPARLAAALQRLAAPAPADAPPASAFTAGDRVLLKSDRGARFVPLADLAAILANDNYTDVFVADGAHFLMRRSLKAWEAALPVEQFARVHRQALVNLQHIERIDGPDGDTPALRLRGVKQAITCSHRLSPELRRRLGTV
jgi:two-component system LytT family response regulator